MAHEAFQIYKPGSVPTKPVQELASISRRAAAEGAVLLRNRHDALPLENVTVSVFGRTAVDTYKSGTGSGGLVNTLYTVNILDGLRESPAVRVNESLAAVYDAWRTENPFDEGHGWGSEPWCQEEMPVSDALAAEAAAQSDAAVIVFGRTAGEDRDNSETPGSFCPTEDELAVMHTVAAHFNRVIVVLNVGNVVSGDFCPDNVDGFLYVWQGGQEGGRAVADVLTGAVNPSGKLADTVAYSIENYPAHGQFGNLEENLYTEDIYVGYRYFETFAPETVLFPFGFGLSYTTFSIKTDRVLCDGKTITVPVTVTNTGHRAGKETVQLYIEAPQGALGKPVRELRAFQKTDLLVPGGSQSFVLSLPLSALASYDDGGKTGHRSSYVLEAGSYGVYVGNDVRHTAKAGEVTVSSLTVTEVCTEALSPVRAFDRLIPRAANEGYAAAYEPAPLRTVDTAARIRAALPPDSPCTGDRGIRFADVEAGRADKQAFLAQLTDFELSCLLRGEGMNSEKVTPGTGCAFGGLTPALRHYGIPIACGTDGPSGIRMDSGAHATSLPGGTLLACTWNPALLEELSCWLGVEMIGYNIDFLLGPGINIHRHPLNGRNFEYFSEDPLLAGKMAAAVSRGLNATGCGATIKHFTANSQELSRRRVDSVASERAYREIYLRPFEIAVKEGAVRAVMTSYNRVNGVHAAINYDLNTVILRGEWKYTGFVMTDWWPELCDTGTKPDDVRLDLAGCVRAQNDVYMVCPDTLTLENNISDALQDGTLHRGELLRDAGNVLSVLLGSNCSTRFTTAARIVDMPPATETVDEILNPGEGQRFSLTVPQEGDYELLLETESHTVGTAQNNVRAMFRAGVVVFTVGGDATTDRKHIHLPAGETSIRLRFENEQLGVRRFAIRK